MSKALILINAEVGKEKNLMDRIKKVQNVKEIYMTYGVFDLIALVEAETQDKLRQIITRNIRALSGIKSTLTMIVVE